VQQPTALALLYERCTISWSKEAPRDNCLHGEACGSGHGGGSYVESTLDHELLLSPARESVEP